VYSNAHFGQGTGPILLDDLLCTGRETRLIDCPSGGVGNFDNCNGHADDAGVQCQPGRQVDTELISRPFQDMSVSNDPNQEGLRMRLDYMFFFNLYMY